MQVIRVLPALLIALALSLVGVLSAATTPASDQTTGDLAPLIVSGQQILHCPSSAPCNAAMRLCMPTCIGSAATLSAAGFAIGVAGLPPVRMAAAQRLSATSTGPDPHPPKTPILG